MKTKIPTFKLTGAARWVALPALAFFMAQTTQAAVTYWAGVPGVSADTNWSDAANWSGAQQTYYNEVEFNGVGTNANNNVAVNNVLDQATGPAQMPIWELDYVPTNGNYTTLIDPGVTMVLAAGQGHLMVGADINTPSTPAPAGAVETITIAGPGATMEVGGSINVGQGSPVDADGHNVTLDLSGLDTLVQNPVLPSNSGNGNANWIYVAGPHTVYDAGAGPIRANGTLDLAKTNEITLNDDFEICNQAYSNSVPCAVYLGQVNSVSIGGSLIVGGNGTTLQGAWMKFNPAFLGGGTAPTASFTGSGGGAIANFWICNGNGGPQVPGYGLCDFSGGNISMLVGSMELGQAGNANAEGVLTFDNGVITASSAVIGNQGVSGGGAGVGIVNLNANATYGSNATLIVNGPLTLGEVTTGTATAGTAGTININGGALVANAIVNGGGTATLNVTNGAVTVNGQAGTVAAPLNGVSVVGSKITLPDAPSSTNIVVSSLTTGGTTNLINISAVPPSPSYPVQVPLIKYSGSIGGAGYNFGLGTLPAQCAGYISNNAANSSVDLVLTSGPSTETWTAAVNGNWDTTTANWLAGGSPATYANGSFVQFFDGANSGTVNLTTSLSPGGLTVSNNTLPYTFNGSGYLTGGVALNKQGTNTLVIDNSGVNNFTGGVTVGAGVLQVGNNDANGNLPLGSVVDNGGLVFDQTGVVTNNNTISGSGLLAYEGGGTLDVAGANSFSGPVIVTNSSTLQLGGSSALGSGTSNLIVVSGSTLDGDGNRSTRPIIVSGTGVGGNGALTDTGGAIYDSAGGLANSITLAGDTTFSIPGPNRWDLGSASGGNVLSTGGNAYNLTLNAGIYFEWKNLTVDPALANIDLEGSGTFGVVGTTTFGNPADTLTIGSSATVDFYGSANLMNKVVDDQDGLIKNSSGNNIMAGAMTLEPGYCTFDMALGTTLTISNVLSGSGVLYDNGDPGTLVLAGNSPAFSGGVLLYNGTLKLNGLIGSGITSQSGTTVSGSGTAEGLVDISGGFVPGNLNAGGTFNAAGGLTLEGGASLTNGLATTVGGNSDVTAVTGNLTANGNTIYINPFGGELQSGAVYPLITYTGTFTGSFAGAQSISPSIYMFTITNITTTTPNEIGVIVSGNPANLTWNNGSGNGQWDVLSSANWTNYAALTEGQFENGDNVAFDDSILNAASPATNVTVSSGVTVLPGMIAVNNSAANYALHGPGVIGDSASLTKMGTGTLSVAMTNTYSGNTLIGAGTISITGQLASASSPLGSTNGSLVISNGASLVIDLVGGYPPGDAGYGNKPIIVSGAGVNGQGAIQNVGNSLYDDSSTFGLGHNVTMTGNTTIGAPSRLDWGFPGDNSTLSTGGSNYNLTVTFGASSEWDELLMDTNLGNIDIYTYGSPETWTVDGMGVSLGNPTNIITLHSNVTMLVSFDTRYPVPVAEDNGYNKVIHVMNGATYHNGIGSGPGDYRDVTPFILDGGSHFYYSNGGGGSQTGTAFSGPVTLNGLVYMEVVPGGGVLAFSNVISGIGGLYLGDNGANQRPLVFAAANTYTGITDLRTNTILYLVGNGSIANSTPISLAPSTTLAVTNRTDGTLTLSSGQTLQGVGTVQGSLVASAGSLMLPGVTSTFTNVGTLTVSSNATLSGNITMKLNNTTNDVLSAGRTVTYGGTLTLNNISGTPLAAGNTFKLFKAAGYSGAFSSISPTSPGAGLSWNTSNLGVNGTLSVVSATGPKITSIAVSGTTLTIKANNGQANAQYVLMESTNLLTPLPWTPVLTNSFDNSGDINMSTNIINPSIPDEYFILQTQ
jgi:fibronectin-binding autotransporter adhesin